MRKIPTRELIAEIVKERFTIDIACYNKYLLGDSTVSPSGVTFSQLYHDLYKKFNSEQHSVSQSVPYIKIPLREYLEEMVNKGRLYCISNGQAGGSCEGSQDKYFLTEYGKKYWENNQDTLPVDRDVIIPKVKEAFPEVDGVTIQYIEEGVTALSKELFLSSAVCLGAASENEILNLIDFYIKNLGTGVSEQIRKKFEN